MRRDNRSWKDGERERIKSILKTDAHVLILWLLTIELNLAGQQRQPDNYVTRDF